MAITFVASSTATGQGQSGATVAVPAGTSSGDRMLAFVAHANVTNEPITPEGWKLLATSWGSTDGGSQQLSAYTRRAASADSGTSVTFAFNDPNNDVKSAAVVVSYSGSEGPVEVRGFLISPYSGSNSWVIPVPDLNVSEVPAVVVSAGSYKASPDGGFTLDAVVPAGTTELGQVSTDGGGSAAVAAAGLAVSTAGIVEGGAFTWSTGDTTVSPTRAATTFAVSLFEGAPPALAQPVFRRWTAVGWVPAP